MARDRTRVYAVMHRLRKLEEEARARDTMAANQALLQGQQLRAALERTRQEALHAAGALMARPEIDASDMRVYYQYERHLARAMDRQDAENRKRAEKLAEEQRQLNAAAVRRRIVERLAERDLLRRAQAERREQRKHADEAAAVRALLAARKAESQ